MAQHRVLVTVYSLRGGGVGDVVVDLPSWFAFSKILGPWLWKEWKTHVYNTGGLVQFPRSPISTRCWVPLTHWGRVMHICVSELTIIGSDNGLSPERHQAIIWTNAGMLIIGPLRSNFSEISIVVRTFSFKKMHFKCRLRNGVHFVSVSMY